MEQVKWSLKMKDMTTKGLEMHNAEKDIIELKCDSCLQVSTQTYTPNSYQLKK